MLIPIHPSTIWLRYKAVFIDDSLQVFQVNVLVTRYFMRVQIAKESNYLVRLTESREDNGEGI